jgi:hypothetical protein
MQTEIQSALDAYIDRLGNEIRVTCRSSGSHASVLDSVGTPYNPVTGTPYTGPNMVSLLMATVDKEFGDNRWLTREQIKETSRLLPDADIRLQDGAGGVEVLHPTAFSLCVIEDDVQRSSAVPRVLFRPVRVFNAEQVDGFPPKVSEPEIPSAAERVNAVEDFISSTGLRVVHMADVEKGFYSPKTGTVAMPPPSGYISPEAYTAEKLSQCVSAVGTACGGKPGAVHDVQAVFDCISPAATHVSRRSVDVRSSEVVFSGGDARSVYTSAVEAGRIVSVVKSCMHEPFFTIGPEWLPTSDKRLELIADAKKKLNGMTWYERIQTPGSEAGGRTWYERDCDERAEAYTEAYIKAVNQRERTYAMYEDCLVFDKQSLADIKKEIENLPVEFSFKSANNVFFVNLNKDREIIDCFEQSFISEGNLQGRSQQFIQQLDGGRFSNEQEARSTFNHAVAESHRVRQAPPLQ